MESHSRNSYNLPMIIHVFFNFTQMDGDDGVADAQDLF